MATNDLYPVIAILVITYDRYDEVKETIAALAKHIQYPQDRLRWVVSDDSTPNGLYLTNLKRLKVHKELGIEFIQTPDRSGWGKHVNFALEHIRVNHPDVEYVFQIEDDYVLERPLDLRLAAGVMETRLNIGMLRFRGTNGTHVVYHQFETDVSAYAPDFTENSGMTFGNVSYLQLDSGSPSLWLYSNGAHLKRVKGREDFPAFHEFYGMYPEGRKLGDTETAYAHMVKDRMKDGGAPAIAILPDWIHMHFRHIGQTFKDTDHDIEE